MATICLGCANKRDIPHPPIRVSLRACDFCGGFDANIDRNYSIAAMQIPGSQEDPNKQAEMEERTTG